MRLLIYVTLATLLFPAVTLAYPEFIGYKYTSCVTCHYNSQGNGPLNDYGRALWSSEIAGRLFSGNKTAEELGESSGFLGKTKMWWWLRPSIKARQLAYHTNPGKSTSDTRFVTMQADANIALHLDKKQKYVLIGTFGYAPVPYRIKNQPGASKPDEWISREHYLRWQSTKNLWLYAGMMDKVYGIRINNHTAYSRARTGLAQNDQAHGIVAHYIEKNWEASFNGFLGNMNQQSELRQEGFSAMFEYHLDKYHVVGSSILMSSNDFIELNRFGLHSKTGYGNGASMLFEVGILNDKPKNLESKMGYYLFSQAMQRLVRGYHFFIAGQAYKEDLSGQYADNLKVSTGFLMFPMARTELRVEVENTRKLTRTEVQPDIWAVLAQFHISL